MYSGLTIFTKHSGAFLGAHQKMDRVARRQLRQLLPEGVVFPKSKEILHFEGLNGPDGIKRKSPGKDEPWHYFNPFDEKDTQLLELIRDHFDKMVTELKVSNMERVAFEAAWIAHAIVDGLTPAHHYPYEEKLSELRQGEGLETRTNYRKKLIMTGETRTQKVKNNWKMWGAGGLYTTHASFEMGVATLIKPLNFGEVTVTQKEIRDFGKLGVEEWFRSVAREIAVMDMYKTYYKKGWTPKLALQVRQRLAPMMVHSILMVWYMALVDAKLVKI